MKEELELKLVEKFPKFLKDYKGDPKESRLAFGVECGNGWYNIIHDCFTQLEAMCKFDKSLKINIQQIKEKFGTIRIYASVDCDKDITRSIVYALITHTETLSEDVCEVAGDYGSLCKRGMWYKTLSYDVVRADDSDYSDYIPVNEKTIDYWKYRDEKNFTPIAFGVGDHPDYKYDDSI